METAHLESLIELALCAFRDCQDTGDEGVLAKLREADVDTVTAEKLTYLVPIAFGRILLSHMGLPSPPKTFTHKAGGTLTTKELAAEPVFVAALKQAMSLFHEGPKSLFDPAAAWGPEIGAVNKALSGGTTMEQLKGAKFGEPVIWTEQWAD